MEGRCQCGTITFTTPTSSPFAIYICHCTECRHQSSSTYGLTALFPTFNIDPPHPNAISVYTRLTLSGRTMDCFFCSKCGSRLMHKPRGADICSVKAGSLLEFDLKGDKAKKAVHIWTKEAIVDIPEGTESYEAEPPLGSFETKR